MSNNENLTVWQRLSATFGPNSLLNQDIPTYKFDKKELLRTQNKDEYERQKLQAQQSFYLSNQWAKIDNHLYTQAVYYEPTRLASVYDFESMEYSLFGETKIATPNGFITIKELADKGRDYEFITYAYDHNLKKVVPAKAYNAHYTRDEMTYKITFDDNSYIIATHGHRLLKRDGVFCVVEELQIGDSMMPFYRKSFYDNQNYNWVYTCNKDEGHNGWVKEDSLLSELSSKELDNINVIASKIIPWDLLVKVAKEEKSMKNVSSVLGISIYELDSKIKVGGFNDWATFMKAYGLDVSDEKIKQKENDEVLVNHKIISIEPYGVVPVYDLTVPGYKNFATDTIFSHNTPEIGAALDIYAEESTTANEDGHMLQIYSESKRIKSVLTDLFNNVLDINTSLPMWTRNTAKFGDNFVFLKLDPEKGVVGCNQLPNIEIERLEPGSTDKSPAYGEMSSENQSMKFRWKNKQMEFQPWEIAHFRILGDDRKLPYGTSLLEKARRIWKQLLLAEDAMLIYRTSRAPERRVFKVFVGNMDDNDVEAYVQRVANKFKREQIVDSKTGNVDMRYNQMAVDQDYFVPVRDPSQASPIETLAGACISLDTRIPLLNGKTLELSEIIKEWDNGNRDLWVYSCNPENGDLAPGLITWAGITRRDAKVLKITLDNGEQITTTPDHKFVHRYDGFVEAQNLKVGDSLMPFYRKQESNQIWNINTLNWSYITQPNETKYETLEKDWEVLDVDSFNNHKIVSIEILTETMDTGTITVDGNEIYHNYHTFAIESGIFIKNSNLGEIADIEYIQKKLVTALRIPKTFLGFEDVAGEGKTLALQDIRFARTINRIQKCMISELNKIAIIHLFLLGFEDEVSNFTLGLTNPSTQSDLLKIDVWKEKIGLYRDAVADPGTGISPVSATWAKKHIFGFSDEEIRLDLQQQRIERAVGEELKQTPLIIKKTGLFDNIDKLYGTVSGGTMGAGAAPPPPSPTDMGGMDMGGMDMGAPPPEPGGTDMGGLDLGMPPPSEPGLAPESRDKNLNILLENNKFNGTNYIPLSKGEKSLGDLENELKKLLGS